MADILVNFSQITVPTPQPYDRTRSEQNRENLAYIITQIIQELKNNNFVLTFPEQSTVTGDLTTLLTQIRDAIKDLQFGTVTFGTPDFSIKISPKSVSLQS